MSVLTDVWYCSDECRRHCDSECRLDRVQEYSKALLWEGLNHLVRRDAVREGDGQAMLDHWALDLIQFSNNGHYKYTILAHQLLFGMATCGILFCIIWLYFLLLCGSSRA